MTYRRVPVDDEGNWENEISACVYRSCRMNPDAVIRRFCERARLQERSYCRMAGAAFSNAPPADDI